MLVKVDPEVKAFLSKKNKSCITLEIITSGGGCCPTMELPEISYVSPKEKEKFQYVKVDDLDIYVGNNVRITAPQLKFTLSSMMFLKKIEVAGITYKKH